MSIPSSCYFCFSFRSQFHKISVESSKHCTKISFMCKREEEFLHMCAMVWWSAYRWLSFHDVSIAQYWNVFISFPPHDHVSTLSIFALELFHSVTVRKKLALIRATVFVVFRFFYLLPLCFACVSVSYSYSKRFRVWCVCVCGRWRGW